jgi:hypothetical protein
MPTRGRPKGSGRNGGRASNKRGKEDQGNNGPGTKGKSGVLSRALEYIKWLEEGRDALKEEIAAREKLLSPG